MTCYWAGKKKISSHIASKIIEAIGEFDPNAKRYMHSWEPFIGMGSVMSKMIVPLRKRERLRHRIKVIGSDNNEKVIDFWNEIKSGWRPPSVAEGDIEYEEYKAAKEESKGTKGVSISPIHTFLGYSCGFQGQYFNGNTKYDKFYTLANAGYNSVMRVADVMSYAKFFTADFFSLFPPSTLRSGEGESELSSLVEKIAQKGEWIIYMDPPYKCAPHDDYKLKDKDYFDFEMFWKIASLLGRRNLVFVSESDPPSEDGWKVIWEKSWNHIANNNTYSRQECLYLYPNIYECL